MARLNRAMKLALIRRQYSATGGAELYLQRLVAELIRRGHEVHLFAESWTADIAGVAIHQVVGGGSRAERPRRFAVAVQEQLQRQTFDCVFSLERTLKQDVYRAGDGVHRVWLERRRQFASWWRQPFIGAGGFHRTMKELEAATFDPANTGRIIVNSEMVKREILEHFPFPAERIHLVRNGVEVAKFARGNRAATRARFGVRDDEFLLLFVGSGWERKGLKLLLQALELPEMAKHNLKLLVVGKGSPPARVPENVIFAGAMTDVEEAYSAGDLFVFPPIYEPASNVVIEALAAGLPVVTSAQNGASELIDGETNGCVVADPSDLEALAAAILHWHARKLRLPPPPGDSLSLERNVTDTLAVLELAAKERM